MTSAAVICPSCGHANPPGRLFCQRCIAPLEVQSLADLSPQDLQHSLTNLLDVLVQQRREAEAAGRPTAAPDALWTAYLNAFWLRPGSALPQYLQARAAGDHLARYPAAPLLEIGVGTGIHSALLHGWRFDPLFDAFQELALDAADVFDAAPDSAFRPQITAQGQRIDYGLDIKDSMVRRARALGVFGLLARGSALALPFARGAVGAIYSNMLGDFEDDLLAPALAECRRVLQPGGYLHLATPNDRFRDLLYYYPLARRLEASGEIEAARRALRLDRGRHSFSAQQRSPQGWGAALAPHDLEVVAATPFAPRSALALWDTGLRPFTPILARLAAEWRSNGLLPLVKPLLVAGLAALLAPFMGEVETADGGLVLLTARAV